VTRLAPRVPRGLLLRLVEGRQRRRLT